jgi:ribosome maturation protein SDO1
VLQIHTVFLSVSKAQTAPAAELAKAFGAGVPQDEIIQEILRKGEVQVGERERKEISERVEKEVVDIVSGRLIDPTTKRVYTPGMIEKALNQLSVASGHQQQNGEHGASTTTAEASENAGATGEQQRKPLWKGVSTNKSAKSQALEAMKALIAWQPIPVMRARMRLRVTCPASLLKQSVKAPAGANGGGKEEPKPSSKGNKKGQKGKGKKHQDSEDEDEAQAQAAAAAAPKAPSNVKDKILSFIESVESQEIVGEEWEIVGFAEPGALKGLSEFVGTDTRGRGRVEVLDMAVTHED